MLQPSHAGSLSGLVAATGAKDPRSMKHPASATSTCANASSARRTRATRRLSRSGMATIVSGTTPLGRAGPVGRVTPGRSLCAARAALVQQTHEDEEYGDKQGDHQDPAQHADAHHPAHHRIHDRAHSNWTGGGMERSSVMRVARSMVMMRVHDRVAHAARYEPAVHGKCRHGGDGKGKGQT